MSAKNEAKKVIATVEQALKNRKRPTNVALIDRLLVQNPSVKDTGNGGEEDDREGISGGDSKSATGDQGSFS